MYTKGCLRACGAHARRAWTADQPAPPCVLADSLALWDRRVEKACGSVTILGVLGQGAIGRPRNNPHHLTRRAVWARLEPGHDAVLARISFRRIRLCSRLKLRRPHSASPQIRREHRRSRPCPAFRALEQTTTISACLSPPVKVLGVWRMCKRRQKESDAMPSG
jgi:hypothetical protein